MSSSPESPADDFPPFRPRPPWWGGDLQTLRNSLALSLGLLDLDLPGTRLELAPGDGSGDRLVAVLNEGRAGARRPLAVLLHGLTGCEASGYMVATARHLTGRGHPVLRLNLRGAGPSAATCRQRYHAGRGADIAGALAALDPVLLRDGVVLAGYSLGGNILLNFLASHGANLPVRAAASVSAPIDLAASSRRIQAWRNRLYERYLVRRMKADWAEADITEEQRAALDSARSVYEFDDRLVAPQNGFGTAERYYAECSAQRVMGRIAVPTLLIQAENDPWIPVDAYRAYDWAGNAKLTPLLSPGGGHVGFHQQGTPPNWHDACIGQWFAAQ
ncbi:MAG: alpha/beta fold hydrolase [Alphaproteobacteria bacterium]|nr:alpha/beta fold hydrolase [Alphaproteobacteria bacterium]